MFVITGSVSVEMNYLVQKANSITDPVLVEGNNSLEEVEPHEESLGLLATRTSLKYLKEITKMSSLTI